MTYVIILLAIALVVGFVWWRSHAAPPVKVAELPAAVEARKVETHAIAVAEQQHVVAVRVADDHHAAAVVAAEAERAKAAEDKPVDLFNEIAQRRGPNGG